jgi:hypothetical protein
MPKMVYDMGLGHVMTLANLSFQNGLYITDKEDEIELLRSFRKSMPSAYTEEEYDATNPLHTRLEKAPLADTSHIINGVHTTAHMARRQELGINDVLNATTDGTAIQQVLDNPDSPIAQLVDIEALQAINTPNAVNLADVLGAAGPAAPTSVKLPGSKKG